MTKEEYDEWDLIMRCRELPADDEEIEYMRRAVREMEEKKGRSIVEAHIYADEFMRHCLNLKIFGPHFDVP